MGTNCPCASAGVDQTRPRLHAPPESDGPDGAAAEGCWEDAQPLRSAFNAKKAARVVRRFTLLPLPRVLARPARVHVGQQVHLNRPRIALGASEVREPGLLGAAPTRVLCLAQFVLLARGVDA